MFFLNSRLLVALIIYVGFDAKKTTHTQKNVLHENKSRAWLHFSRVLLLIMAEQNKVWGQKIRAKGGCKSSGAINKLGSRELIISIFTQLLFSPFFFSFFSSLFLDRCAPS